MLEIDQRLEKMGLQAKEASKKISQLQTVEKNEALLKMADALEKNTKQILEANQKDIDVARENGLNETLIERLTLTEERVQAMQDGLIQIANLKDPVGQVDEGWVTEDGLRISKRRVPLGVIGIIYESRPNVTVDASALCLKAGNAVILRGGKEALNSNLAIEKALKEGLENSAVPVEAIQVIPVADREISTQLMQYNDVVDCLIPRGGAGLIQAVLKTATVPVIETGEGNTHIYIEKTADVKKASDIVFNAKVQRPSVCNAVETLVVDEEFADANLSELATRLIEAGVEIRGDEKVQELVSEAKAATEEDYAEEHLDLILTIKTVKNLDEATTHIQKYSTQHSEAILTENYSLAEQFLNTIDSAAVYVNASTRFTDGEKFGFGGEIGISTQKLHARGPMGLEALTSYKYVIEGTGQIRK